MKHQVQKTHFVRSSHRMVLFKLLLLLGGAAGRVVFDKVERDGDYSGSESSDGNNIMFFEEETDDEWWRRRLTHSDGVRRGYATVVDDDLNTVSEVYLRMDVDCGEMDVDDCGGEMLGTICGDRAVVVVGGDAVAFRMELDSRQDERGFSVEGNAVQVGLFLVQTLPDTGPKQPRSLARPRIIARSPDQTRPPPHPRRTPSITKATDPMDPESPLNQSP